MSGLRSRAHAVDFIAKFFLRPETLDLRPDSLQPFPPHSASHYTAHACLSGLTAYLLNVKVFVWFNPSISGDRYASASKGVEPQRCLCAILVLTPRNWEIGGAS